VTSLHLCLMVTKMASGSTGPDEGVQFPSENGRRSSQRTARSIFSAAARSIDADAAERFERTDSWRKNYLHVVPELVEMGAASAKNAGRIASDGLDALRSRFVFEHNDDVLPLGRVFDGEPRQRFDTAIVNGQEKPLRELTIPYRNELLRGDALKRQLAEWSSTGTIEPSCARALQTLIDEPERLDLSDQAFAILGAASEMGPFPWLCRWGATIHAVDIPNPEIWDRIIRSAQKGSGRVAIPIRKVASGEEDVSAQAGVDLIKDLPEVFAWLEQSEEPFTLGDYAYADGALFARLAVATDTLAEELLDTGKAKSYAYLASPTDVFAVTPEIVAAARANRRGVGRRALRALTAGKLYSPSYSRTVRSQDGEEWGLYDCLIAQQGANYSLAKSIQRWRAVATHENGFLVSANVAPATKTRSVVKNKILAAAYAGARPFGVEIFEPETSSALMAAMLANDLRDPPVIRRHPFELFVSGAAHGGLWRMPYEPRSVLPLAVVLGYTTHRGR
jgi:hypothetical protein